MEYLFLGVIIIGVLLLIIAFIGCILPGLPGPPISFLALLLLKFFKPSIFTKEFLISMGIITVIAYFLDYFLPVLGAKMYKASNTGIWFSIIGMVIGIFFIPPFGMILGLLIGAIIGELISGKAKEEAIKIGFVSFLFSLLAILIKIILVGIMSFYFVEAVIGYFVWVVMKIEYFKVWLSLILIFTLNCQEVKNNALKKNSIIDDLNNEFTFVNPPQKVISLAPNLTEIIFKLGLGAKIVGNTTLCNYPDSAKTIKNVGDLLTVDLEKVISLNPDLIFITVEGNSKSDYDNLIDLGFTVFVSNPRNFNGIKKTVRDIGRIFQVKNKSENLIKDWEKRLKIVKGNIKTENKKSVLFLISINPIFTVGKNSFINEIINSAGLNNIADDLELNYPMFNREEVIKRNPDYIILMNDNADLSRLTEIYPEWKILKAIKNKNIFTVNADIFSRPGPRIVEAVEQLNNIVNIN